MPKRPACKWPRRSFSLCDLLFELAIGRLLRGPAFLRPRGKNIAFLFAIWRKSSIFVASNKTNSSMEKRITRKMAVTPEEEELIYAIRDYCDGYPNSHPDFLMIATALFEEMTRMPK